MWHQTGKHFSLSVSLPPLFKSSLIHRKWKGLIFDHGTICKVVKAILKITTYNICSQKSLFKIWRVLFFFFHQVFHISIKNVSGLVGFPSVLNFLVAAVKSSCCGHPCGSNSRVPRPLRCCNNSRKELYYIHEQVLVCYRVRLFFCLLLRSSIPFGHLF